MVTDEEVIAANRFLLGRDPGNEKVVQEKLATQS
jgi:hypothetical protein